MLQDFQRFRADDVYILCELSIHFDDILRYLISLSVACVARNDHFPVLFKFANDILLMLVDG